ncbi:hypothetical protein KY495_09660 [Massilia sp. PAMC28688]|uniref:hypothetical protein n=1 Tax=Massilia sp. PAMC28688 TaxID=2861283 RepID=UPI001C62DF2C|nr:hypothetical protein [Massilia sp. PAMC28688]QYF95387.1 hypothetical protein KY495_09660 [Massilia sp. PAMC28688]
MSDFSVGIAAAIGALGIGAWCMVKRRLELFHLKKQGIDTVATVVESRATDGHLWEVVAEFTHGGTHSVITVRDYVFVAPFESGPPVGSQIHVVYSWITPGLARIAESAM